MQDFWGSVTEEDHTCWIDDVSKALPDLDLEHWTRHRPKIVEVSPSSPLPHVPEMLQMITTKHCKTYDLLLTFSTVLLSVQGSDILVLKIILVLVFIQFWVNNFYFSFSFSFEIILVSISVLVSLLK